MREVIRGEDQKPVGYIDRRRTRTYLLNWRQIIVGVYDRDQDVTYDGRWMPVGRGDQLLRLLPRQPAR